MDVIANSTVPVGSTDQWHDRKRSLWLIALVMPALPFVGLGLHALTGWGMWWWIGPIVILGIVPIIDLVAGLDRSNPPDDLIQALENDRYYRWITYAFLPIQYAGFVGGCWLITSIELGIVDRVGVAVTLGVVGGIGINTAHELGHKRESHERWLSKIALAPAAYGHFYIEHNRGHHVRVATPADPASSRVGENFYQFWPRTVLGSLASAWRLERRRYARHGKHPIRPGNDVLNAWAMTLVLWGGLLGWLGIGLVPYLAIQALAAITLLEAVNYLEHYGMLRGRVGVGARERWERVDPTHSWNSNNVATNILLYHLQRHSDHHANPTRRYQSLRDYAESPVLPTGYAGMILLAAVPPLWRRVMDPRVLAHFDGDILRANVSPRKRARIMAAHGRRTPIQGATTAAGVAQHPAPASDPRSTDSVIEVLAARCPGCRYTYEVAAGDEREGFAVGTPWARIPDDWCCPDCGVRDKAEFVAIDSQAQEGRAETARAETGRV